MKILTISTLPHSYLPDFIVLFNKSAEEVNKVNEDLPETFIFPFSTGKPEDVNDMSGLNQSLYIAQPLYLGNFNSDDDVMSAAIQIVKMALCKEVL